MSFTAVKKSSCAIPKDISNDVFASLPNTDADMCVPDSERMNFPAIPFTKFLIISKFSAPTFAEESNAKCTSAAVVQPVEK